jgi:hypothetical protein
LGGAPVLQVGAEVIALVGGTAMALFLSVKVFRWEVEEKITRNAKLAAVAVVIPFLLLGVWENSQDARRSELRTIFERAVRPGAAAPAQSTPQETAPQK